MRARALAPLLALLLLATGCGGSADAPGAAPTSTASSGSAAPQGIGGYVALGDSYTAAPYVYLTDVAGGCLRSNANYPSLVAETLDPASFDDVSCSGATTQDVTGPQQTIGGASLPAQVDAVSRDTAVVTLGIGGNDNGLFGSLVGGCFGAVGQGRPAAGSCGTVDVPAAQKKLLGLRARIAATVKAITAKAPNAEVMLVGYPHIVEPGSTCKSLPLPESTLPQVDRLVRGLNQAVEGAADQTGATYVDVYAASEGHDICAGQDAWINGVDLDTERAAPFHPFAAEQEAVAKLVEKALA